MNTISKSIKKPPEVARAFADAYVCADLEAITTLLHPEVHEKAVLAGGSDMDSRGRDAFIAGVRNFFAGYERAEVLRQTIEPVGPFFRWSARLRLQKEDHSSFYEWHAFVTIENGLIKRIDVACTGDLPEK